MSLSLSNELLFLILQFCNEANLKRTAHMLEQETGIFFDIEYFEILVISGDWDEAERYLSGFMGVEDNIFSMKIYSEMRKHKFLEALHDNNGAKALDVLVKELKVFAQSNKELYDDMTRLLTLDNFRNHRLLSSYGDAASARKLLLNELRGVIEACPLFQDKLKFPEINKSRLRRLINHGLNWQHRHCTNPQPEPEITSLFTDHKCSLSDHPSAQSIENRPLPSQATLPAVIESGAPDGAVDISLPINADTTLNVVNDSDGILESSGTLTMVRRLVKGLPQTHMNISDDLPKTVAQIFNLGSSPTSMDFHPNHTILLVGTSVGDIEFWEVISGKKILARNFGVRKVCLVKDPQISITRTLWSPDGSLFGVAFSKQIVKLYSYLSASNVRKQLQIDAHDGGVNDLAFSKPYEKMLIVTCGDDKLIKVWDVTTGAKQYTFEGHRAPLYSLCAHSKENTSYLFSTSMNGEINAWLFDDNGLRVSQEAPSLCCMRMVYSADGKRLFSCGTNKDGESRIIEWNESEGSVQRSYRGLCESSSGDIVKFDISRSGFLAAGDDHVVKFWNLDNNELLTAVDADGDLPEKPYICFNKTGTFLAVFTNHNQIKILANCDGIHSLKTSVGRSVDDFRVATVTLDKLAIDHIPNVSSMNEGFRVARNGDKNDIADEVEDEDPESAVKLEEESEMGDYSVIDKPSQCQSLKLPHEVKTNEKISNLTYTNAGNAIIALAESGIHLLWKWSKNESNFSGVPTTSFYPQQCLPKSRSVMTNSLTGPNKTIMSCFALSKNDCYVISASGGAISLLNTISLKRLRTLMSPPSAATYIAFCPQDNNILAIGMDDSTIIIYNFRTEEVVKSLKGHSRSITGLAFSHALNVLVSSGQDARIVVWNNIDWKKNKSRTLSMSMPQLPSSTIHVQFHQDQTHFLVVHDTQLAIYETTKLECINQWNIEPFCGWISHASFSCDSQLVYASFQDGKVLIFDASSFHVRCVINPSAYLPTDIRPDVYPLVIAAHPKQRNQFALGLLDGTVLIIEPQRSQENWEPQPPAPDNE